MPKLQPRRQYLRPIIVEMFGDGKWHSAAAIAHTLKRDEAHVAETLRLMRTPKNLITCEHKIEKGINKYRIFRGGRAVNISDIKYKLLPIIKGLKEEGKKNAVTMSPPTVARLAALLERQIDEWVEGTRSSYGRPDELAALHQGVGDKENV